MTNFRRYIGRSVVKSLIILCCLASPAVAKDIDPPHHPGNGYTCATCHTIHGSLGNTGYNNVCVDCHKPGVPRGGAKPFLATDAADPFNTYTATLPGKRFQTSHRWDGPDTVPQAGAQPPLFPALTSSNLRGRTNNSLACVRCHNQHYNSFKPFLRMANDGDELCLDCHSARNKTSHTAGTHPVNVNYSSSKPKHKPPVNANPANPTSAMKLINGKVLCTTCHVIHYADSNSSTYDSYSSYNSLLPSAGYLLRTDLHGASADSVNICTNCHAGKKSHNAKSQNVQCPDCHAGHVDYDPNDPGGALGKNTFLVRRYMNISTVKGAVRNKRVMSLNTLDTVRAYRDAGGNGVCQACHVIPPAIGAHSSSNPSTAAYCNGCHVHNDPKGSFTVNCASCHGYPPTAAVLGGPDGLAVPATGATGPINPGAHAVHAITRTMGCEVCHNGYGTKPMPSNTIDMGFAANGVTYSGFAGSVTTGTLTGTTGLNAPYTWSSGASPGTSVNLPGAVNPGCSNLYCHGSTLTGGSNTSPSWVGGPAQAACGTCHGASAATPPTTGSHTKHAASGAGNLGLTCSKCHPSVTDGSHVNGSVAWSLDSADPQIGGSAQYRGARTGSTGSLAPSSSYGACSTTYCHGTGAPIWGATNTNADCTWCHGGNAASAAPITKDKHTAHMNQAAVLGINYECAQCHSATVSAGNDRSITGAVHANGTKDLSMLPGGAWDPAAKSCTGVYCHSNGKGTYANPPVWTSTAVLGCNGCHGTSNAQGAPDYTSGAAGSATANSHTRHVLSSGITCTECHYRTTRTGASIRSDVGPSRHTNTVTSDVFFNLSGNSKAAGYTPGIGNKTCSATYCHGANAPQWGGTTICNSCHSANNSGPWAASSAHRLHWENATLLPSRFTNSTTGNVGTTTTYRFTCASCHRPGAGAAVHAAGPAESNGDAQVFFGYTAPGRNPAYTYGATQGTTDNGFKWTDGSVACRNTYCHSNGQTGAGWAAGAAVSWATSATSGNCGLCHGTATSNTLSGKHQQHVNNAAILGANLGCVECHAKTVDSNTHIGNKRNHVNKFRDFSGAKGQKSGFAAGICSAVYCHSNGKVGTSAGAYFAVSWTAPSSTLACNTCHGNESGGTIGYPNYANGGAGSTTANSHQKHSGTNNITCDTCHNSTAAGNTTLKAGTVTHLNGAFNVTFDTAKAGATVSWAPLTGTCANISCHGNNSAIWGGTLHCQDCHGGAADLDVFTLPFTSASQIATVKMSGEWDTTGHGRSSGIYDSGNDPAGFTGAGACEYCHDPSISHNNPGNVFRLKNYSSSAWGRNEICQVCHAAGAPGVTIDSVTRKRTTTAAIGSRHFGAKHGGVNGNGGQFCWDCHDPHGDANIYMVHESVAKASDPATGAPTTTVATSFISAWGGADYVRTSAPYNGICNVCHTATSHYTASYGDSHNITTLCISCHPHSGSDANSAFKAVGYCDSCHGYPPVRHGLAAGTAFRQGNYSSAWFEDYSGGGGAHSIEKHVKAAARASEGWVNCAVCHSKGSLTPDTHTASMPVKPSKITVDADNRHKYDYRRQMGPERYTGKLTDDHDNQTGACSNVKCHFKPARKWSTEK